MKFPFRKADKSANKAPKFSIGPTDIPADFWGLSAYPDPLAVSPRVDREAALSVPAVKRGRDLIAGTLGTLPVDLYQNNVVLTNSPFTELLMQPEAGLPRSITMARTIEDLLFDGVAWWLVVETGWHGYPTKVKRLDPRTVDVTKDGKIYVTKMGNTGMAVEYANDWDLIRFDSPNAPLLTAGARAIRTSLALDTAANRYANGNQPLDYFTATDGYDLDQEELDEVMESWRVARRLNSTAYVPAAMKYTVAGWNPEQLQLAEARQHASLEISRLIGVDPEDLGISTTSRTYQNSQERYQSRIKDTLRGYYIAVEERLSMNDVLPRGYTAKFNFSDLTRADDNERFNAYKVGLEVGVYADSNEIRIAEGKPTVANPITPAELKAVAKTIEEETVDAH